MKSTELPHFVILSNETPGDHVSWINACEDYQNFCTYSVVNLTSYNWLEEIQKKSFSYLLAKPGGLTTTYKTLYDERIKILADELNYPVFPSLKEILIYENKRYFSYWLKANKLPCPDTFVFYSKDEVLQFLSAARLPLVTKINIGASGRGVKVLKTIKEAKNHIEKVFSTGITSKTGPRLDKGQILKRVWRKICHPVELKNRITTYKSIAGDIQKDFIIIQEFVPHKFEWRVVRIGDSFFAHKKMVRGEKASGLLLKEYSQPPKNLLSFVKDLTDKFGFYSQAIDIFESPGGYLINEMQCIFGQSDPHQMLVNNKPGRFRYINNNWVFEEGNFNTNKSYNLRIEFLLSRLNKKSEEK